MTLSHWLQSGKFRRNRDVIGNAVMLLIIGFVIAVVIEFGRKM